VFAALGLSFAPTAIAKLVGLGFWETGEPGDPAGAYHDAKTLHDRVGAKLAGNGFLVSTSASNHGRIIELAVFGAVLPFPLLVLFTLITSRLKSTCST
jgi:hypothetical protein